MNRRIHIGKSILFLIVLLIAVQNISSQASNKPKAPKIDQSFQAAFDALKARKWAEAIKSFEEAQKIQEKEKEPSVLLFTLFTLPDEDNSPNEQESQIIRWRHSMATAQALVQFLSFTHQLAGNSAQAEKYFYALYDLQGPMWGLSWRIFAQRFCGVFNDFVKTEKGENFGRYQYYAAALLLDAGEKMETVFEILQSAQQNAPKDPDVAGLLANGFLQKRNPKEAKKQAEFSLSIKPGRKSVLIDLATAEWLLADFDNSIKHAEEAAKLDAKAPGPHLTLALNYIEKKDFPKALAEAETAVKLSNRHFFYLMVQAAAFEASGNSREAEKLLREAYKDELPSYEDLDIWYVNKTLRDLVLKIVERLSKPKTASGE